MLRTALLFVARYRRIRAGLSEQADRLMLGYTGRPSRRRPARGRWRAPSSFAQVSRWYSEYRPGAAGARGDGG